MAKTTSKVRGKFLDEKHLGPEPVLVGDITENALGRAYNWFNYFYTNDDAKEFAIAYLKGIKYDRKKLKLVNQVSAQNLRNIGWNCRLISNGSEVTQEFIDRIMQRIEALIANEVEAVEEAAPVVKTVISIQDRINEKTSNLIGDLEEQVDIFIEEGRNTFNAENWMKTKDIKPQIAQLLRIVGYRVEVIEFVGGEHTPRNLMIRAVKTDAKPEQLDIDRYLEITAQWGLTPALEKKLPTLNIR